MAVTRSMATKKVPKSRPTASSSAPKTSTAPPAAARSFPDRTPDGRYIIVKGRRWRATDPLIPESILSELKHYLGRGRSGVRSVKTGGGNVADAIALARQRTGLAKLGLGERGKPEWWNDTEAGRKKRWEDALEKLRALDDSS